MKRGANTWLAKSSATMFVVSGVFWFLQVVLIGLRRFGIGELSEFWIAPFAIAAVVTSLMALVGLSRQLSDNPARLVLAAANLAKFAGVILCLAAVLLVGVGATGGSPQDVPSWFPAVIAVFMVAFILSFIFMAVASIRAGTRLTGYLLLVPPVSWGVILAVGLITNFGDALRLDFYTNGAIACAFFAIGLMVRRHSRAGDHVGGMP